jgi:hypothetical protein
VKDCHGKVLKIDPIPTGALPGTEEKIALMEARAEKGLSLFHPAEPFERRRKESISIIDPLAPFSMPGINGQEAITQEEWR